MQGFFGIINSHDLDNVLMEYVDVLPDVPHLLQTAGIGCLFYKFVYTLKLATIIPLPGVNPKKKRFA